MAHSLPVYWAGVELHMSFATENASSILYLLRGILVFTFLCFSSCACPGVLYSLYVYVCLDHRPCALLLPNVTDKRAWYTYVSVSVRIFSDSIMPTYTTFSDSIMPTYLNKLLLRTCTGIHRYYCTYGWCSAVPLLRLCAGIKMMGIFVDRRVEFWCIMDGVRLWFSSVKKAIGYTTVLVRTNLNVYGRGQYTAVATKTRAFVMVCSPKKRFLSQSRCGVLNNTIDTRYFKVRPIEQYNWDEVLRVW